MEKGIIVMCTIAAMAWGICEAIETRGSTLATDQRLESDQQLRSDNGNYNFVMQNDCNLVLYRASDQKALWSSGTHNKASRCYLKMQSDANLVVYTPANTPIWASKSTRRGTVAQYRLIMQNDGNAVIYDSNNKAIWASKTRQENVGTRHESVDQLILDHVV